MLDLSNAYYEICLIRRFEELLLDAVRNGKVSGTTHTSIGQEANAVGIISCVDAAAAVWSNHRCHGHFISYSKEPELLLDEILGKSTGVCGGRGGSQHLCFKNFFSSGIQGGFVPVATGYAEAQKQEGNLSIVFLGDGTLGQGVLYESLNIAIKREIPILFVIEDNRIAQTTPFDLVHFASASERFEGFGMKGEKIESTNVKEIYEKAKPLVEIIRKESSPRFLHIITPRLEAHSKGDDTRTSEELQKLKNLDPIDIIFGNIEYEKIKKEAFNKIENIFHERIGSSS